MPNQIGRYQIRHQLGRGGMSTVYLAYDLRFRRYVALKILPPQFMIDPEFLVRFRHEARLIASLEHVAIVPVYDFGEFEGQPYLVMRYMSGGTLREQIQRGPLPLMEACRIVDRLSSALDKAHSRGIIHRDIKTANVLFDEDGEPYLSDFGSARMMAATFTSSFAGTPNYMAPEQWAGEDMDARTDVYQMGALLYEMLTGRIPFEANTPPALMHKHLYAAIPSARAINPIVPPACDAVIRRAMAKKKSDRYTSAGEMAADLRNAFNKWKAHTQSTRRFDLPTWKKLRSFLGRISQNLPQPFWIGLIGGLIFLGLATLAARGMGIGPFQSSPTPSITISAPAATQTIAPTRIPITPTTPATKIMDTQKAPTPTPPSAATETATPTLDNRPTVRPTPTRFPTFTPE